MEIIESSKIERVSSSAIEEFEAKEIYEKSTEMYELLKKENGLGLAAPQVGIFKRMFVVLDDVGKPETIFNPHYYRDGGKTNTVEGCLSYPGEYYYLKRWKRIHVVYYVWNGFELIKKIGKLTGLKAITFQHESDHLSGKTIALIGEKIDEDKLKKKKNKNGEEFKIPQL